MSKYTHAAKDLKQIAQALSLIAMQSEYAGVDRLIGSAVVQLGLNDADEALLKREVSRTQQQLEKLAGPFAGHGIREYLDIMYPSTAGDTDDKD